MSYAPKHIADLGAAWVAAGGIDLGIVGDSAHPSGYHVGRDRIYSPAGQGDDDYSVKLQRDRDGLTNAASALDFGHNDKAELRDYSNWLVTYCQGGGPGSQWVREVIYSPDGKIVQRWSGVDGQIHPGWPTATGNGDASHLTHTHLSVFRDAQAAKADLTPLVTTWAFTPPDTGTEAPMIHVNRPARGRILGIATVKDEGTQLCDTERPTVRYPQAVGTQFSILAGPLELVDVDVDGNSPPKPGRREVYLLDDERPGSNAAFGLVTNFDVKWQADCSQEVHDAQIAEYNRVKSGTKATVTLTFPDPPEA